MRFGKRCGRRVAGSPGAERSGHKKGQKGGASAWRAGLAAAIFLTGLMLIVLRFMPAASATEVPSLNPLVTTPQILKLPPNLIPPCWKAIGPGGATGDFIARVAVSPDFAQDRTLFAVPGWNKVTTPTFYGIFVSRDGGESWRNTLGGRLVTAVGVSPGFAQDGVVIAAGAENKAFVSRDRGETWREQSIPCDEGQAIAFSPDFLTDKTVFLGGDGGLLVSRDGGDSWEPAGNLHRVRYIAVSPAFAADRTLFAGCLGYSTAEAEVMGVWKSTDSGRSWTQLTSFAEGIRGLALSPRYPADRTVYALWSGVLHVSRDGGATWAEVRLPGANASALAVSPQYDAGESIFIGTDRTGTPEEEGVFRYQSGSLTRFGCGLEGGSVLDLAVATDRAAAPAAAGALRLFAAATGVDRPWGEVYTLALSEQPPAEPVTKEGLVQYGSTNHPYWLAVQTEDARYALSKDDTYPAEYAKLAGLVGKAVRVTGYLDSCPDLSEPVRGCIRVIGVQPVETAPPPQELCRFGLGAKSYTVGGQTYQIDVAPYVKNGRSYVSIRYLAGALGVLNQDITWNPATKTVILRKGDTVLFLTVDSKVMRKQVGSAAPLPVPLAVAPEIRGGRLCLPARYVAEGLGYQVRWNEQEKAITVMAPGM
ncbi:MAG: stalk domain-containing protein [Bacillota bacterium]